MSMPTGTDGRQAKVNDMNIGYSIHQAKAQFLEVLRHIRQGGVGTVLCRGKAVAQIREMPRKTTTIHDRLNELKQRGVLAEPGGREQRIASVHSRPGALARFLSERNG